MHANAVLTIDLRAIAANYRQLCDLLALAECAGVVKADAYGLGVELVAPTLWNAGCRTFFVATFDEGVDLRRIIADSSAEIGVLNGMPEGAASDFHRQRLTPVLNHLGEVAALAAYARAVETLQPAVLNCDTGMNRLGLDGHEVETVIGEPARLDGIELRGIMSHLACAEDKHHPLNREQLARFNEVRARLPAAPASLANSSGIYLGSDYHLDQGRPGVALYGANPTPGEPNPMREVVRLEARILQVRDVDTPQTVGYGATHRFTGPSKIPTVSIGYADVLPRSLSNGGQMEVGGVAVPVIGWVSMDTCAVDVSGVPAAARRVGAAVTVIGGDRSLEALAAKADTIAYEVLTRLGRRYARVYRGEAGRA